MLQSTDVVDSAVVIRGLARRAPELLPYFGGLLIAPTYTVSELNTVFRYEVIRLGSYNGDDTTAIREWLYEYPNYQQWLTYFNRYVLPYLRKRVIMYCGYGVCLQ